MRGVGVCFFVHPETKGSRIAHITQDRQRNNPTPFHILSHLTPNRVMCNNTNNVDVSLSSVCCDVRNLRDSWFTTTDV